MQISPKVIAATLVPLIAAALLWLITGDDTYLVAALLALTGGGAAAIARPAPGVDQKDVAQLSRRKRGF